ncbi:NtaA/DmoA family FMN-dependent monooxygenase [Leucobacter sp. CSA1]|uniref:NtaA/DmoA family FMN-dependent monooxygenase n=1 Tax=Leucobacter chromiisoli TaxID=2796471 RepID=A0A934UVB5_9MICO|nr:NtaA/DmoA family FMN-dependent monooxygenase [Leucobacter chromiisoli]MBK0419286.1 NtaA/DmoA family FMN-dependent monooxygenase [Leucobacter chromiisoli]
MSHAPRPERDHLILAVSYWPTGATNSGWRSRSSYTGGIFDPGLLAETARLAERGVFDYFFWGNTEDSSNANPGGVVRNAFQLNGFTAAAHLAGLTSRIGLVASVNTTYSDPYLTAQLASNVDHLSRGRFGVNFVAGAPGGAAHRNFGHAERPDHADAYTRANEYLEVFTRLQDSWSDDWFVGDKERGRLFAPEAAEPIDFVGEHFRVAGPLNAPRSPQGRVPILHAGTSQESFELGARYADVRFSPYASVEWNRRYAQDQRELAVRQGRSPEDYAFVVGANIYVAETRARARELFEEVQAGLVERFSPALVARHLGIEADRVRAQSRVAAALDIDELPAGGTARALLDDFARITGDYDFTFDDLFRFAANKKNFPVVVGDPGDVADWIEEGYVSGAFDGVKVFPPFMRSAFGDFVDFVVPELQRRGIARSSYTSDTLRGHLGLPRPAVLRRRAEADGSASGVAATGGAKAGATTGGSSAEAGAPAPPAPAPELQGVNA